jgi:hypothetical protein
MSDARSDIPLRRPTASVSAVLREWAGDSEQFLFRSVNTLSVVFWSVFAVGELNRMLVGPTFHMPLTDVVWRFLQHNHWHLQGKYWVILTFFALAETTNIAARLAYPGVWRFRAKARAVRKHALAVAAVSVSAAEAARRLAEVPPPAAPWDRWRSSFEGMVLIGQNEVFLIASPKEGESGNSGVLTETTGSALGGGNTCMVCVAGRLSEQGYYLMALILVSAMVTVPVASPFSKPTAVYAQFGVVSIWCLCLWTGSIALSRWPRGAQRRLAAALEVIERAA